ncbi:MAG TPA: serine protease [Burkholderiales bacterium]|nr:serine protease [Burkholderiales bacterium]
MSQVFPGAGLVLAALLATPAQALEPDKLFEKLSPSVFVVLAQDARGGPLSQGSGVVVASERIITSCHVLAKAERLRVERGNVSYGATLEFPDTERDLCQLHVKELRAPPVAIVGSGGLRIGQRVYAIGAPVGLELTMSDGLISSLRGPDGKAPLIQTTAPMSSGSSGGGLFDAEGNLVGIATFGLVATAIQNINFAVPAEWVREVPARARAALAQREQLAAAKAAAAATAAAKAGLPPVDTTLPKQMPQVGDTWTYAIIDVRYKPNDRSRKYTVTVRAVTEATIVEAASDRGQFVDELEFRRDFFGYYRGSVIEVAPFAQAFRTLRSGEQLGRVPIRGIERVTTPTGERAYQFEGGRVVGTERVTVPAGTFEATKVLLNGLVSASYLNQTTMFRGHLPFTLTVWYAPEVKRIARARFEGDAFIDVYELDSYKLR